MKKIILLLLLWIWCHSSTFAQWQLRGNNITKGYSIVNKISIPSEKIAYAISDNVFMLPTDYNYFTKTINGGNSWTSNFIPGTEFHRISDIEAISNDTVWLLYQYPGDGTGKLYKTTNGGTTWDLQSISPLLANMPKGIHFFNSKDGVLFSDSNFGQWTSFTTADGGKTWNPIPSNKYPAFLQYEHPFGDYATSGNTIWFGTTKGRIFRSVDKGHTWTVSSLPNTAYKICNLAFNDSNVGLAIATTNPYYPDFKGLYRTTDGGLTWTDVTPASNDIFFKSDLCFVPGTQATFVLIGYYETTAGFLHKGSSYSIDGGLTWNIMTSYMVREATSVNFLNQSVAYAGTYAVSAGINYSGGIYRFTAAPDAGVTAVLSPVNGCYERNKNVCIQVRNLSTFPASHIPVNFTINGGTKITETIPGPLIPGYTVNYCFTQPAQIDSASTYTLKSFTTLKGDLNTPNDTSVTTFKAEAPLIKFQILKDSVRTYSFKNLTIGASAYTWHFGDNNTSTLPEPTHTYLTDGIYEVKLIAVNVNGCQDTLTASLDITTPIPSADPPGLVGIFPNPTTGVVYVAQDKGNTEVLTIDVFSSVGQFIGSKHIPATALNSFDLSYLAAGVYVLKVMGSQKPQYFKIVLVR